MAAHSEQNRAGTRCDMEEEPSEKHSRVESINSVWEAKWWKQENND
jgi:hypothetical protein